ncbi:hypothetical protein [Roseomonas sp. WA12]
MDKGLEFAERLIGYSPVGGMFHPLVAVHEGISDPHDWEGPSRVTLATSLS